MSLCLLSPEPGAPLLLPLPLQDETMSSKGGKAKALAKPAAAKPAAETMSAKKGKAAAKPAAAKPVVSDKTIMDMRMMLLCK